MYSGCVFWRGWGKKGTIRFSKFHLMPSEIWRQIRNGMSSGVTEFSSGIIIFFFNQAILKYIGEYALVSYTIISYVNTIVVMSMAGIAQSGNRYRWGTDHGYESDADRRR